MTQEFSRRTALIGGLAAGGTLLLPARAMAGLLDGLGIESGVDLAKLASVGDWISRAINRPNGARAGRALCTKAP